MSLRSPRFPLSVGARLRGGLRLRPRLCSCPRLSLRSPRLHVVLIVAEAVLAGLEGPSQLLALKVWHRDERVRRLVVVRLLPRTVQRRLAHLAGAARARRSGVSTTIREVHDEVLLLSIVGLTRGSHAKIADCFVHALDAITAELHGSQNLLPIFVIVSINCYITYVIFWTSKVGILIPNSNKSTV